MFHRGGHFAAVDAPDLLIGICGPSTADSVIPTAAQPPARKELPDAGICGIMGAGDGMMTPRDEVNGLLDRLTEDDLAVVARMLRGLLPAKDPLVTFLGNAPEDDEPYTEEEQRRDAESREAYRRGEGIPHAEIGRRMKTQGA